MNPSETECFLWAFINADTAINAGFLVDFCFLINFDCFDGTCCRAGSTTSAFLFIDFYSHNDIPSCTPDTSYPIYFLPFSGEGEIEPDNELYRMGGLTSDLTIKYYNCVWESISQPRKKGIINEIHP